MKIEVKENHDGGNFRHCEYPSDYTCFGTEEFDEDLKIFIQQQALKNVDEYLSGDLNNELGGVLVGDICVNNTSNKFILIDNLIIAKHSNSSLSRLTFTHETWDYINEVLERDFPDKKILGWFHSHPGHTVFLSNFDIFIQENFFNMDYMVAYVFDPSINDRGFFAWRNKKIIKTKGFCMYDIKSKENFEVQLVNETDPDLLTIDNLESRNEKSVKPDFKSYLILGLLLLTILLLLIMIYNFYDLKQKVAYKVNYEKDIAAIQDENRKLKNRLDEAIGDLEIKKSITKQGDLTNNASSISSITENSISNSGSKNTDSAIKDTTLSLKKYLVKTGDTLEKISSLFYKSREGIELIMKQNNIKKKTDIKIGQVLELPNISVKNE